MRFTDFCAYIIDIDAYYARQKAEAASTPGNGTPVPTGDPWANLTPYIPKEA